jgi:hypothetical protein
MKTARINSNDFPTILASQLLVQADPVQAR